MLMKCGEIRHDSLKETMARYGAPRLVVFDTLNRNFGTGDENDTASMTAVVCATDKLRAMFKCHVMLLHHSGVSDKERGRGSTVRPYALDNEYRMDREGHSALVRLVCTKMKDAEEPAPMAFALKVVELGLQGEDGKPATSCVLESTEYQEPKRTANPAKFKNQGRLLEALKVGTMSVAELKRAAGVPRNRFDEALRALAKTGAIFISEDRSEVRLSEVET
jgi:hypothetical protein